MSKSTLTWFNGNSFLASGDFCCLLITFANSLDLGQEGHSVAPDLDTNCLTILQCFWKNFMRRLILK